jgi:hypothetical protein
MAVFEVYGAVIKILKSVKSVISKTPNAWSATSAVGRF